MWRAEIAELRSLIPAAQLWVIAQPFEENRGPPPAYAARLRDLADRLEALEYWLAAPLGEALGERRRSRSKLLRQWLLYVFVKASLKGFLSSSS
jgi:hypothetical protein